MLCRRGMQFTFPSLIQWRSGIQDVRKQCSREQLWRPHAEFICTNWSGLNWLVSCLVNEFNLHVNYFTIWTSVHTPLFNSPVWPICQAVGFGVGNHVFDSHQGQTLLWTTDNCFGSEFLSVSNLRMLNALITQYRVFKSKISKLETLHLFTLYCHIRLDRCSGGTI